MKEEPKKKEPQLKTENRIPNLNANIFQNFNPNFNPNFNNNINPNFKQNCNQFYPMGMPNFNAFNNNIENNQRRCECGELLPKIEEGKPQLESCPKCGKKICKKEGLLNKILKLCKIMISFQIMNAYTLNQCMSGFYGPMCQPYPPPMNCGYPMYYPPPPRFCYPPYPAPPYGPMGQIPYGQMGPMPMGPMGPMGPFFPPYQGFGTPGNDIFPDFDN